MTETLQSNSLHGSPLDGLVIYQLQELLKGKTLIERQYAQLRKSPGSEEKAELLVAEIADLNRRADRLSRFMEAMT